MHVHLGGRVRRMHFGGTRWQLSPRLHVGLKPWTGRADYEEEPALTLPQRALVTAAGPLANLVTGALAFSLASLSPNLLVYVFAWMGTVCGALNLLPVLHFDGKRLLVQWMSHRQVPLARRAHISACVELLTFTSLASGFFVAFAKLLA